MPDGIRLGGAFYELTLEDANLIRGMARSQTRAKSFSDAIAKSMASAASSTEQANRRIAQSTQQASAGFTSLARSSLGFVAAAAGVTTGAAAINQAMTRVAESTQRAADTQFKLTRVYGTSASEMATFANGLAKATGNSNQAVVEGIARFGVLMKGYGLTRAQVEKLTVATLDLAAANGVDTVEAFERMIGVFRDGGESAEKLSLVLNDQTIKSIANLTAEQKKNFEQMGAVEKSQIRYTEAMRQAAVFQGAAAEKAGDAAGAFKVLDASVDNLSVTVGQRFAPGVATAANAMTFLATSTDTFLKTASPQAIAGVVASFGTLGQAIAGVLRMFPQIAAGPTGVPTPIGPDPGMPGGTTGGLSHEAARNAIIAIQEERKRQAKRDLEAADKANDATAESAIKAIDKERKAKEQWYDEERSRIEARRTYVLEDIEQRRDAELARLEEEKRSAKDAIDDLIADQERLKDARLAAAEAAKDQALAAIDVQKRALDLEREASDRDREDTRRDEDRALETARRLEDRTREQAQDQTIRALERERDVRLATIEADIEAFEKASQKKLRAIDRQAERARQASDDAIRAIDRQADREDERHRKALRAIDAERDARLKAIDEQLRGLDALDTAEDNTRRTSDAQRKLTEAQGALGLARGSGTPQEIAAAREELTRAIRIGNEVSVANAREQLAKLAGQGAEAVKKAEEDLAEAQEALRKEGISQTRDAERAKLQAAKDAIGDELDARRDAEDEESRRRKKGLDHDKQAEQDKLDDFLKKLEKRKQARQDADKEEAQLRRNGLEAEKQASQESIQRARDEFDVQTELLQDRRRDEDGALDDRRLAEDRDREDRRAAQDRELEVQKQAIAKAHEDERAETEAHFNGPNGTITKLKKASEDTEREYSRRLAAVRAAYEAERKAAELKYTNPEGNGELQLLEKQRIAETAALEARKTDYEEQAKAHHQMIVDMIADLDAFIAKGANIPRIGGDSEAQRSPGSGKLTSSSTAQTASRTSGKKVQGDVISWLNDAMDLTGVPDNWLPGLKGILDRESFGGDPHAKNPKSTASGLFQLIDSTWKAYRDKDLPNNVFDPVANAVAGIRYIKDRYGNPNEAIKFWERQNPHWYDRGGMIREPVIGRGVRSGRPYAIAEYGPEYVIGRQATAAMIDRRSALGPGPSTDYRGVGAALASVHPGGTGRDRVGDVNNWAISGIGMGDVIREIRRQQHRHQLHRGVRPR